MRFYSLYRNKKANVKKQAAITTDLHLALMNAFTVDRTLSTLH